MKDLFESQQQRKNIFDNNGNLFFFFDIFIGRLYLRILVGIIVAKRIMRYRTRMNRCLRHRRRKLPRETFPEFPAVQS